MHLFLSPHYDDAVYSCGGTIHQLTQRGESVTIITIMGGSPPDPLPDSPIVRELHQRWQAGESPVTVRQQEDHEAARLLGATVEHLDVPDCIYRTDATGKALYPDEDSLWHHVHPDDPALKKLSGFRIHADATHLYMPLGVGGHVDHLITRRIGLAIVHMTNTMRQQSKTLPKLKVFLYEDYPYRENPDAVKAAYAQLDLPVPPVAQAFHLTEADILAKIRGVKAYRSQVSTFWKNETLLEQRVRAALHQGTHPTPAEYHYQIPIS